jgi:hypothetical protein
VRTRTHVINRKRLLPSQAINDPMKDSVALTCGFDDFVAVAAAAAAADVALASVRPEGAIVNRWDPLIGVQFLHYTVP